MSVQKVTAGDQTWSVSCPSCPCSLCSPLVSTSSPPTTATNMWTYLTRSALPCVVLGVSTSMFVVGIVHVCGGQCTCVCLHTCTYVYVLLLYTYVQYQSLPFVTYIQSFMATLMVVPSPLLGSVSMKACTLHLSLLRPPLPADYRIRFNFRGVKCLWRAVYILPADYVVITNRKDPTLSRPRREDGEPIKQIILPHTQLRGGGGGGRCPGGHRGQFTPGLQCP